MTHDLRPREEVLEVLVVEAALIGGHSEAALWRLANLSLRTSIEDPGLKLLDRQLAALQRGDFHSAREGAGVTR